VKSHRISYMRVIGILTVILLVAGLFLAMASCGDEATQDDGDSGEELTTSTNGQDGEAQEDGSGEDVISLSVVAAWPLQADQTFLYHEYIDRANEKAEELGIPLVFEKTGGPEVVKASQMFEAMRNGTIDMAYSAAGYYSGEVPEMSVLRAIKPDAEQIRQAVNETGLVDEFNSFLQERSKVRLLGLALTGRGFKLLSTKRIDGTDWSGLKVRAPGAALSKGVETLGGAPVMIPAVETFTALQQGVVDAVIGTAMDRRGLGEIDVYEYIQMPPFAASTSGFFIGKETYDSLPEESRKFLDDVSKDFQEWQYDWCVKAEQEAMDAYIKEGVEVIELSEEDVEKETAAFREGYLDYVVEEAPDDGPRLKEMIMPYVR